MDRGDAFDMILFLLTHAKQEWIKTRRHTLKRGNIQETTYSIIKLSLLTDSYFHPWVLLPHIKPHPTSALHRSTSSVHRAKRHLPHLWHPITTFS